MRVRFTSTVFASQSWRLAMRARFSRRQDLLSMLRRWLCRAASCTTARSRLRFREMLGVMKRCWESRGTVPCHGPRPTINWRVGGSMGRSPGVLPGGRLDFLVSAAARRRILGRRAAPHRTTGQRPPRRRRHAPAPAAGQRADHRHRGYGDHRSARGHSARFRATLQDRAITPCIPSTRSRKRPHDAALYRQRHPIKIIFGRLKDWRRIALRYDRCAHDFFAAATLPPPSPSGWNMSPEPRTASTVPNSLLATRRQRQRTAVIAARAPS